ncbi:hypothetical protein WJX81_005892 [Elliptochloris bilobata]|uniref:Protein kinase domain-containing protein n=1 Tax=Elliptochloris bilobata TaxID=381761 RepID=A0AAW1QLR4_9CHLO
MQPRWEVMFCMPPGGWDLLYDRLEEDLPPWTVLKRACFGQPLADQVANSDVLIPTTAPCGAEARGIPVCTSPGVNAASVAEAALMLVLMLARRVPEQLQTFAQRGLGRPLGMQLAGKTLGIVGMGAIGVRLAKAAQAGLGMHVIGLTSRSTPGDLANLLGSADVVSLHCPLTLATHGLLGATELRAMKRGALLVNYGRGELIDKQALVDALRDGHLGGAGLDVFWEEPADPDDELFSLPNVIALPHTGVCTHEVMQSYAALLSENIERCPAGAPATAPSVRHASTGQEFAAALSDFRVRTVLINGTIVLTPELWRPLGGTANIVMRNVSLAPDPAVQASAVLDFGGVSDSIMVGMNGRLSFTNMTLRSPAPTFPIHTASHARFKVNGFGPWPSVTVLPNATVVLNQTRVYYYSDPAQCEAFLTEIPAGWRRLGLNDSVQVLPAEHEADLTGVHRFRRQITDIVINETVGSAAFVTQDLKCFCPPVNPWPLALSPGEQAPAPAPASAAPAPAPAPGGGLTATGVAAAEPGGAPAGGGRQGGGLTQAAMIALIAVLAAVATAIVAAGAAVSVRLRQQRHKRDAEGNNDGRRQNGGLLPGAGGGLPDGALEGHMARMPSDPRRSPSGSSNSVRRNSSGGSPHAASDRGSGPDFMMRSVMSLPDTLRMRSQELLAELEIGQPLGRGSYGRVYRGKWKGVQVAVKIVEHSSEADRDLSELRESVLSTAIQHPNVVSTYKVRTIRVVPQEPVPPPPTLDSAKSMHGAPPFGTGHDGASPAASMSARSAPEGDQRLGGRGGGNDTMPTLGLEKAASIPEGVPLTLPEGGGPGPGGDSLRVGLRPPRAPQGTANTLGNLPDGGSPGAECSSVTAEMRETWMLLEYCDRGNLDRAILNRVFLRDGKPNLDAVLRSLIDIAAGMDYLHSLGVLHGDLKGPNVLLKTSVEHDPRGFCCKIADFGLARVLQDNATHVSTKSFGTVAYMPAEVLQHNRMSRGADVYSFAMIMWELLAGRRVYEGYIATQVFFKVLTGFRPEIPESAPAPYAQLMAACWSDDADKRPPFDAVLRELQAMHSELLARAASASVESQRSTGSTMAPASSSEAAKAGACDWPAARRDREDSALASGDRPCGAPGATLRDAGGEEEEGVQAALHPALEDEMALGLQNGARAA